MIESDLVVGRFPILSNIVTSLLVLRSSFDFGHTKNTNVDEKFDGGNENDADGKRE